MLKITSSMPAAPASSGAISERLTCGTETEGEAARNALPTIATPMRRQIERAR